MIVPNNFWTIGAYHMEVDRILLVTKQSTLVIDSKQWEVLSETGHKSLIHPQIMSNFCHACQPDYESNFQYNETGFLQIFKLRKPDLHEDIRSEHPNIALEKVNNERIYSWVARFDFVHSEENPKGRLVLSNPKEQSVLLTGDDCW